MGSYSDFIEEDILIRDHEGLKAFIEKAQSGKIKEYKNNNYIDKIKYQNLSFDVFDGWKIIQYWYDDFLYLLRDLALFIEGYVVFLYETEDEKAIIHFENHRCRIKIGVMSYCGYKPEELGVKIPEQSKEMQQLLLAKKI